MLILDLQMLRQTACFYYGKWGEKMYQNYHNNSSNKGK